MKVKFFSLFLLITFTLTSIVAGDGDSSNGTADTSTSNNIKLGFGLTALAAGASALGSLIPFLDLIFPYIPGYEDFRITQSKGFLAGSLSFSAGVLTFLTISDLYPTATNAFNGSNLFDPKYSGIVFTAIFSVTMLLLILGKKVLGRIKGKPQELDNSNINIDEEVDIGKKDEGNDTQTTIKPLDVRPLKLLGFQVAVALAIHNIPEGFANFVTIVTNPQVGILFAIALALHKIPEGLIISLPIYYATNSRWIAFGISGTVGVTAGFVGALIGYALTENSWNGAIPGFIFSIIVGFLLYIIFKGMFPLARHYDPTDKYCTYFTCGGFVFVSLVESLLSMSGVDA